MATVGTTIAKFDIKGLQEMYANLKRLEMKIQKKVAGKALRAGAKIVQSSARSKAPRGKKVYRYAGRLGGKRKVVSRRPVGFLRRGIIVRRIRLPNMLFSVSVGLRKEAFYGKFIEKGWTPTGRWKKSGRTRDDHRARAAATRSKIPGRPFMGPAVSDNVQAVIAEVTRVVREELKTLN